jgi:putative ABC transport system permease protein
MALAVLGLYGVVAFAVTQRRRDLAVHVAMGARPSDVLRLVLVREMKLVAIGLVIGLVIAAGEAALLSRLVIPLASLAAPAFVALACVLLLATATATLVAGSSALRIAPMQTLRQE